MVNPFSAITSIASLLFPSKCISCTRPIRNEEEEENDYDENMFRVWDETHGDEEEEKT